MVGKDELIKVSLVVPVFNVELYLAECLNSLLLQTLKEIEIIIVDDGSTDHSGEIANQYAQKDRRIRVIHQENRGLAAARNRGIELAKGKYIAFVDSDDWVKVDAYQGLYERADFLDSDIVLGSIIYYEDGEEEKLLGEYGLIFGLEQILRGKECLVKLIQSGHYLPMVYMNLFRREFIRKYGLFFKYSYHEDEYFTPYALYYADRVTFFKEAFYYYRQREGSIMRSVNYKIRAKCYFEIADALFEFVERLLGQEEQKVLVALLMRASCLYAMALRLFINLKKEDISGIILPPLKYYKLNLWRGYFSRGEFLRLNVMYYRLMNEQKIFSFLN